MMHPGGEEKGGGRIAGLATREGTARYRERFAGRVAPDHFRESGGLWLSSLGIGTYLGEPSETDDVGYRDSVVAAVEAGCNVIDTAVNYRFQRSERAVGEAVRTLMARGYTRAELVVATKGGFIPYDGRYPRDPLDWFRSFLMEPGIAAPDDVVADCHIMTPRYLESQIGWSLRNLGLEAIDIYYVHNPETQLTEVERPEFLMRVKAAFTLLERMVASGVIGAYGVATWDGLRVPPERVDHLSLKELRTMAEQAGGPDHSFRFVQAPVNLAMPEACLSPTQWMGGRKTSLLEAAAELGMTVMTSGSLLQGRIIGALGPDFAQRMPQPGTNAQRGLQVVRSTPGVATALVGMKQTAHVAENLGLAALPRLPAGIAVQILEACSRR